MDLSSSYMMHSSYMMQPGESTHYHPQDGMRNQFTPEVRDHHSEDNWIKNEATPLGPGINNPSDLYRASPVMETNGCSQSQEVKLEQPYGINPLHHFTDITTIPDDDAPVSAEPAATAPAASQGFTDAQQGTSTTHTCTHCGFTCSDQEVLVNHFRETRGKWSRKYQCTECCYSTNVASRMNDHSPTHAGQWPFPCVKCRRTFRQRIHLFLHTQKAHEGLKFTCDKCHKTFTQRGSLSLHVQTQHEGLRFTCDKCSKSFSSRSGLAKHVQTFHEGVRFSCDKCSSTFTQQSSMYLHIRTMHDGIKKYPCNQCDRKFNLQNALSRHMETAHSGH